MDHLSEIRKQLLSNLAAASPRIQVILGPRQVGKTTAIQQFIKSLKQTYLYTTADNEIHNEYWLEEQWQNAVQLGPHTLLVVDEVQKIPNWSEKIKKIWDASRLKKSKIKLVLLGSSSLQIQKGLSESLTGRFELIRAYHWGLSESEKYFKMNLEQYLKFGGYPGSYDLIHHPKKWQSYIQNSIIDTVVSKDILMNAHVKSPALFRQAFDMLCCYPAQEISYTKLLGQLQDKGNTNLIKYYIELYEGAFLIKCLSKFSIKPMLTKSSSPKILPLCPALCQKPTLFDATEWKGRVFEAAVGAELLKLNEKLFYWRDGNAEVDYVLVMDGEVFAIEVKSGRKKTSKGLTEFAKIHKKFTPLFITLQNFEKFSSNPRKFLENLL